jgi:ATP adenylyltransferase
MPETDEKLSPDRCHLCAQIAGEAGNDLLQQVVATRGYVRRVVFESADFAIVPSIGALVEGHVLALPKLHARSFAQLAVDGGETAAFLDRASAMIETAFGSEVQMFEHGTGAASAEPACSVEHAHVHLVPCRVNLLGRLEDRYRWTEASDEVELRKLVGDGEYLRVRDDRGWMVTTEPEGFSSQLLRRELHEALGPAARGDWNWRANPRAAVVSRTFARLSGVASVY